MWVTRGRRPSPRRSPDPAALAAIPLYHEALQKRQQVLGDQHPDTVTLVTYVGTLDKFMEQRQMDNPNIA